MIASALPEQDFRRPGCSDQCKVVRAIVAGIFGRSELLIHDPDTHEQYGALSAMQAGLTLTTQGTVRTGVLEVNVFTRDVRVHGELLELTPTEAAILVYLAKRLGHFCSHDDIHGAVWPQRDRGYTGEVVSDDLHLIRVNVSRLRTRLGADAGPLLVTQRGAGYFLEAVEPGAPATPRPRSGRLGRQLADGQWAESWRACRNCGQTTHAHVGKGFCTRGSCWRAYRQFRVAEHARRAEVTP